MLFNPKAIQNKLRYLDAAIKRANVVNAVVSRHISSPFRLTHLNRVWEPGGGATLFRIESPQGRFLLKCKSEEAWVESRLECELSFPILSSLKNEYRFLEELNNKRGIAWVPRPLFLDSADGLEFLAVEWLCPFIEGAKEMSPCDLLRMRSDLRKALRCLFDLGIVHTDIHEHNLCLREKEIVIIDFEEARFLKQELPFEISLDVVGMNKYGNVGQFPAHASEIGGFTCFQRLELVFKQLVRQRLELLVKRCHFDQRCSYNLDPLQASDERIYQSVRCRCFEITGQRPQRDLRLKLLRFLLKRIAPKVGRIVHVDIGCNLGAFCLCSRKLRCVERSIGIDASEEFINAASALAFLSDAEGVDFVRLECGEGSISESVPDANVVTMFSVYHHIRNKERLLEDLRRLRPKFLIAEFATQDRFYPERGSLNLEIHNIRKAIGFSNSQIVAYSPDYRRPIFVFGDSQLDFFTRGMSSLMVTPWPKGLLRAVRKSVARATRSALQTSRRLACVESGPWSSIWNRQSTMSSRHVYERALNWISQHSVPNAGVQVSVKQLRAYPEVSGYFIPTLLSWGQVDLANRFARWLVRIQNSDGSWSDAMGRDPYTFDTGQILKGLMSILPTMPEAEDAILRGCEWLLTQIDDNGRIGTPNKSAWGLPGGKFVSENIHLYAIQPLREASVRFDKPIYEEAVQRALTHYRSREDLVEFNTLSHFHAYVIEGLIDLGELQLARKGMERVNRLQKRDGSVPAYPGVSWVCSTGIAQYAVVWSKLGEIERAQRAFAAMCRLQNRSGGFYGSYGRGGNYFPKDEISWAIKFCLDAYYWHVRTSFDADSDQFPERIDESDGRYQAVLSGIGPIAGKRILDAGCGKGRFSRALISEYPSTEIWGVDISTAMLKHVPVPIKTKQGSLLCLPFERGFFQGAFSVEALEHSINPEFAVKEICRVVQSGGKIVIVDKNLARAGQLKTETWERWFDEHEVVGWLERYCVNVESRWIAHGRSVEPDGLFIAWVGTRR